MDLVVNLSSPATSSSSRRQALGRAGEDQRDLSHGTLKAVAGVRIPSGLHHETPGQWAPTLPVAQVVDLDHSLTTHGTPPGDRRQASAASNGRSTVSAPMPPATKGHRRWSCAWAHGADQDRGPTAVRARWLVGLRVECEQVKHSRGGKSVDLSDAEHRHGKTPRVGPAHVPVFDPGRALCRR